MLFKQLNQAILVIPISNAWVYSCSLVFVWFLFVNIQMTWRRITASMDPHRQKILNFQQVDGIELIGCTCSSLGNIEPKKVELFLDAPTNEIWSDPFKTQALIYYLILFSLCCSRENPVKPLKKSLNNLLDKRNCSWKCIPTFLYLSAGRVAPFSDLSLFFFQFLSKGIQARDDIATEAYEEELDMGRSGSYLNNSITSAWSEHSLDPDDIRVGSIFFVEGFFFQILQLFANGYHAFLFVCQLEKIYIIKTSEYCGLWRKCILIETLSYCF